MTRAELAQLEGMREIAGPLGADVVVMGAKGKHLRVEVRWSGQRLATGLSGTPKSDVSCAFDWGRQKARRALREMGAMS